MNTDFISTQYYYYVELYSRNKTIRRTEYVSEFEAEKALQVYLNNGCMADMVTSEFELELVHESKRY